MWEQLVRSDASAVVILIRLMVGTVFLSEGIQKFLLSMTLGALFLLIAGAGPWSVDAWLSSRR
jgi:uncharacterized membrane protein YphA (DoxX/SURF4 family)